MSNLSDKRCFKPSVLDKSTQSSAVKRTGCFADKNTGFESSFLASNKNQNTLSGVLPSRSSENIQLNQTFKVPSFDSLPLKKPSVRSISPRKSIKPKMVKSDLKQSQQPSKAKLSLITRPSFIVSRKSLHGSRSAQLNARKELIKQMVFLHECSLKERKELKKSTPVKVLAGLTPKKTPQSGGYFLLPEFSKKVPKLEDIRSPIQDFIKKEMYAYSAKSNVLSEKKNVTSPLQLNNADSVKKPKEACTEIKNLPSQRSRFSALLSKCKTYNTEFSEIQEKLKVVDSTFENKIKDLPDYRVYNEFCFYKSKKEDLYLKLQKLEADFTNFASTHTRIGKELEVYIKKKQEFLEKHLSLHKGFEEAVTAALKEFDQNKVEEKNDEEEAQSKPESPKLRRSLRLSKIKKNKFEEKSPLSKRLRRLDTKSKGIQRV